MHRATQERTIAIKLADFTKFNIRSGLVAEMVRAGEFGKEVSVRRAANGGTTSQLVVHGPETKVRQVEAFFKSHVHEDKAPAEANLPKAEFDKAQTLFSRLPSSHPFVRQGQQVKPVEKGGYLFYRRGIDLQRIARMAEFQPVEKLQKKAKRETNFEGWDGTLARQLKAGRWYAPFIALPKRRNNEGGFFFAHPSIIDEIKWINASHVAEPEITNGTDKVCHVMTLRKWAREAAFPCKSIGVGAYSKSRHYLYPKPDVQLLRKAFRKTTNGHKVMDEYWKMKKNHELEKLKRVRRTLGRAAGKPLAAKVMDLRKQLFEGIEGQEQLEGIAHVPTAVRDLNAAANDVVYLHVPPISGFISDQQKEQRRQGAERVKKIFETAVKTTDPRNRIAYLIREATRKPREST